MRPESQRDGAQPWLVRKEWSDNRIRSHKRWEVIILWGFAVAWSLLAAALAYAQIPRALDRGETLVAGIIGIMLLIAAGLMVAALRATRDARRFGDVALQLDPFPGSIGGHFDATTALPVPYRPGLAFTATLACLHHSTRRTTANDTEASENVLWQTEGMAQVQPQGSGIRVSFRLDVPSGLPESEPMKGDHHSWRLSLESRSDPPLVFERHFDVPMFATAERSEQLAVDAAQHPAALQARRAQLAHVAQWQHTPGGIDLYLPYGRAWRKDLAWLLFGLAFGGFGVLAGRMGAPLIFPLVFGGVGGGFAAWAFFALGNSLKVQFSPQGLRAEHRLLGFMFAWHQAPRSDLQGLQLVQSYTTQTGARHTVWLRIRVQLKSGKSITVVDSLRGEAVANEMLQLLAAATGLPARAA